MARQLKYGFRGLDLRTNELYREEGTASDCRNVRLDSSKRLVKREDFETATIPRGVSGETGEFLDKLPFHAKIIGIMPFDDHKVIATLVPNTAGTQSVNRYYKWDENAGTVEAIALSMHTSVDSETGNFPFRQEHNIQGRIQYLNQENILLFKGSVITDNAIASDGTISSADIEQNRTPLLKYDGEVISIAGVDSIIGQDPDVSDDGVLTNEEYVKFVPFTFDNKNRWTFGDISTLKTEFKTTGPLVGLDFVVNWSETMSGTSSSQKAGYFRFTNTTLNAADSAAARTISAIFKNTATDKSVMKGQYMYSVSTDVNLTPFGSPTKATVSSDIYKFLIEDVDYVAETVTLGDFKKYNPDNGLFEPSAILELNSTSTSMPYCGTQIQAIYSSQNYTFGYEFRGYTIVGRNSDDPYSTQIRYVSPNVPTTPITTYVNDTEFLFIATRLEDMYDEDTVKLPPPKSGHFTNYLGAIVMTDNDALYFSDFSVGGNIETFTPFDNTPVGSSEFGPITGVFANETFLAVFRQRESYYITGNLFTLNYRIQSYKSTRIGCSSPTSIIPFKGSGIFISEKGIYVCAQGGRMDEVSDLIEPLFQDNVLGLNLDMFDVQAVIDFQKEVIYFDFATKDNPDVHYQVVYSYYHQEWFIYEGIGSSGAMSMIDDKLYTSDGDNIYVETTTSVDSDAYYRSNFESLGSASTDKKFVKVWASTIAIKEGFELGIKSYKNWNIDTPLTDEVQSGDETSVDVVQNLNLGTRSRSCAIEFYSSAGNKMIIDGYEYTVEGLSSEFKHDNY